MSTTNYPRCKINERCEWYGTVYDLEGWTGPKKSDRVYLGRHDTQELAEAAFQKWKETGEKPPRRKYHSKHKERSSRVIERNGKFYAKGTQYTEQKRLHLHIGVYLTKQEAQEAADRFIATGERDVVVKPKRAVVMRPKKEKVEKPKRERKARYVRKEWTRRASIQEGIATRNGPTFYVTGRDTKDGRRIRIHVGTFGTRKEAEEGARKFIDSGWTAPPKKRGTKLRVEDIKIAPGRNLRDHEVEVLKNHRPELMGGDPRARRPNESIGDWCRRLEVMKGYRAA